MKEKTHAEQHYLESDYKIALTNAYLRLMTDEPGRVRTLRLEALKTLQSRLEEYRKNGYMAEMVTSIAWKRSRMIMEAETKAEMKKILAHSCPHYDGRRFVTDKYHVPEEELILWSEASLRGPLDSTGYERYCEVFRELFPKLGESVTANLCAANVPQEAA